MRRGAAILVVAMVVMLVSSGCEPKMTISARDPDAQSGRVDCGYGTTITGIVTPHTATSRVVLQKTYGGVWRDVAWFSDESDFALHYPTAHPLRASVNQATGAYTIGYYVPDHNTMHFRVRSDGGNAISPAFYVSVFDSIGCP